MLRRRLRTAWPALGLFLLAPLVAEFLLGNLPITFLVALPLLAPLYGGGAVLIRELARRTGRGWPTMLGLALAYAVLEEGITTMSLFNPNYYGARLLDNGYLSLLGIGGPWTVRVLTLHVLWSISVPIALMEVLAAPRQTAPWLGRLGLSLVVALFGLGVLANTAFGVAVTHFVATPGQLITSALLVVVLGVAALRLPAVLPWPRPVAARAPSPWLLGAVALVATSGYKLLPDDWPALLLVALIVGFDGLALALVLHWSRQRGWGDAHRLALASGALLTYAWHGFFQVPMVPADPALNRLGNAVFAAGALALVALAAVRLRAHQAGRPAQPLREAFRPAQPAETASSRA